MTERTLRTPIQNSGQRNAANKARRGNPFALGIQDQGLSSSALSAHWAWGSSFDPSPLTLDMTSEQSLASWAMVNELTSCTSSHQQDPHTKPVPTSKAWNSIPPVAAGCILLISATAPSSASASAGSTFCLHFTAASITSSLKSQALHPGSFLNEIQWSASLVMGLKCSNVVRLLSCWPNI